MDGATLYRIALGDQARPDPWQLTLTTEAWPTVLVAPTGSGKTAAVTLGWAAHRLRSPEATPRRLVWCLPMRTLVEQTADSVRAWFARLAAESDDARGLPQPDDVHVLMGGVEADRWLDWPERAAVLVGTQDMLLSRALMRGYASSRAVWPMEFALLHEDAQWVFDEVQLMGAGRATSAQLEAFRQPETDPARRDGRTVGMPSRSLWISATLDPSWLTTVDHPAPPATTVVRVDANVARDGRLADLVRAKKRLAPSAVVPTSSKRTDVADYVGGLADAIVNAHQDGRLTLAIVNRVDRAQALRDQIEKRLSRRMPAAPTLALVHSRFRAADRAREMEKALSAAGVNPHGRIVVATQAVEAGVDISAAVLFTELAPWSSLVQRFGRANRYAELPDGADVRWIDLLPPAEDTVADRDVDELARPYEVAELRAARGRLAKLTDVAPVHLPAPDAVEPPRRVIRRKDLDDLFDTDPDLTGFDVDISPYVRDADDTDIRVFWRQPSEAEDDPPRPRRDELCAVSIASAGTWIKSMEKLPHKGRNLLFRRDPQWRRGAGRAGAAPAGWMPLEGRPWPGLVLLAYPAAGGYREDSGFTGNPKDVPEPIPGPAASPGAGAAAERYRRSGAHQGVEVIERQPRKQGDGSPAPEQQEAEGHDEDPLSGIDQVVPLADHLRHVAGEAESLCAALGADPAARAAVVRAAHWHDLGKAHEVFQDTMRRGLGGRAVEPGVLLAKTAGRPRHGRPYFRHELASALAFLAHEGWSRDADLVAYLVAAHHGKVRLNLRALPREAAPTDGRAGARFARGVWEGDTLPPFALAGGERWEGGELLLSVMELGWDDVSRESWTERTRELLARLGPFRLAWLETLLRLADWRASAKEREGSRKDGLTNTSGPARPAGLSPSAPEAGMTGETLALRGCAPTPLASYLKALGVLRLVSSPANHVSGEAADPHARGWWENECFHLRTTLGRDGLLRFFLHDYAPSPIIAPWNGGSGFYAGDNKDGFDPLATSQVAARFGNISSAIQNTVRTVADLKLAEKPEGEAKVGLVTALRAKLPDAALLWLDAVLALSGNGLAYPELLGTGGNDGRLEFTNNFARRLVSRAKPGGLFEASSGKPSNEAARLLEASLLAAPVLGLCSAKIGQFAPGAAGGPNATNGYSANSEVNSWDFVLMLEGAAAFAGAATRRHQHAPGGATAGTTTRSGASFPFTVRAVGAGWGGVEAADENDARAEFWAPIWMRPARSLEINSLLGEGRAVLNERTARDGLDFARAAASLGVSRGFRAFERFGFLMRAGRTYLATPIGRRSAASSPAAQLVADLDAGGWLERVRRVGRNEEEPGAARRAIKRLEDALFGLLAAREGSREVERAIVALGHVAGWLALSPSGRKAIATPPPVLSSAWLQRADDGSAEFRVAAALAALGLPNLARPARADAQEAELPGEGAPDGADREPTGAKETRDSTSRASLPVADEDPAGAPGRAPSRAAPPMAAHLAPLHEGRFFCRGRLSRHRSWSAGDTPRTVVWGTGPLVPNLIAVLERRLVEASTRGLDDKPLDGATAARLADVAAFLSADFDDARCAALLAGLVWARPAQLRSAAGHTGSVTAPFAYAVLKPLFTPDAALHAARALPPAARLPVPPGLIARLRAGGDSRDGRATDAAVRLALACARASGLPAPFAEGRTVSRGSASEGGRMGAGVPVDRLAAALLIPIGEHGLSALIERAYPGVPTDDDRDQATATTDAGGLEVGGQAPGDRD